VTFTGIRPVLHTPFSDPSGTSIAFDELASLTRRMVDAGAAGVVTLGLASEASALRDCEREHSVRTVVGAAGSVPVTVGIGGDTEPALRTASRAAELGAHALMVLPPPAELGRDLRRHFAALGAVGLPMLVQDSPQVTNVTLEVSDLLGLHDAVPQVRAVKIEGVGAGPKVSRLTAAGFDVVAGWGGLHYPETLRRGARGLMPGCDLAAAFIALHDHWSAGRQRAADDLYDAVLGYLAYQAQSLELLILSAKRRLVATGVFAHGASRVAGAALDDVQREWLDRCATQLTARAVPGWVEPR